MFLKIDREKGVSLSKQIYQGIKSLILEGGLLPNKKIPSTRQMAKELEVSRNVVIEAYEQLMAEGYIEAKEGSGTYVTDGVFLENYKSALHITREPILGLKNEPKENLIDFRTGVPNLELFPKELWGEIYKKVCQNLSNIQLDYHEPRGCYDLRYELAQYLKRVRGVNCQPNQIVITTGAAQAFNMLGRMFSKKKIDVVVEDPLSYGIIATLEKANMNLYSVPIDDKGMITSLLPMQIQPRLIFTTPSHQYPMGCILPIKRRIDLIRYAREKSAYIIEDDYDSEFRFEGTPIQSLQSLDSECVIYVGTFSKILCPALRMGYMILPQHLIEKAKQIKCVEDLHSPVLEQLTLAGFIREGYLDRHIRKSKLSYKQKSKLVIKTLTEAFGNEISIKGHSTGIHLVVKFNKVKFDEALYNSFINSGVKVPFVEEHAIIKGYYQNYIMIGYGNLSDYEIVEGIMRMKKAIRKW